MPRRVELSILEVDDKDRTNHTNTHQPRPSSTFEGIVLHGEKIGRTIGFPTANIALANDRPIVGIYAARAELEDGRRFPAIAYYGSRPTVDGRGELLEVFLFGFSEEIYGVGLKVELVRLIRGCRKFSSLDELTVQIARDCTRAREILGLPQDAQEAAE